MTQPFGSIQKAVQEVIETKYPDAEGKVGGALNYTAGQGLYVCVMLVPGGGAETETNGSWAVDIDVFGDNYLQTLDHANAISALLVGKYHRTSTMLIDRVFQNVAPAPAPWEDDNVTRLSATYVFTSRRKG